MNEEQMENLINSIRQKLGDENAGVIMDDLGTIITANATMNNTIKTQENKIKTLKQDKDNLLAVNGNLLQQVPMGQTDFPNNKREEKKEEQKHYSFKNAFDEKGNFKN